MSEKICPLFNQVLSYLCQEACEDALRNCKNIPYLNCFDAVFKPKKFWELSVGHVLLTGGGYLFQPLKCVFKKIFPVSI